MFTTPGAAETAPASSSNTLRTGHVCVALILAAGAGLGAPLLYLFAFDSYALRPKAVVTGTPPASRKAQWIRSDPATAHFVDEDGRVRLFHGLNVVFKTAPHLPDAGEWDAETSFGEADAANLSAWGFNAIRLGVLWAGTFPARRGVADPGYIKRVQEIVTVCEEHGIHVVIDFHSDVLSRRFCGNGMPDWAVDDALRNTSQPPPFGDFPSPLLGLEPAAFFDIGTEEVNSRRGWNPWGDGSAEPPSPPPSEPANCWDGCGGVAGPCDDYCGPGQACCKTDYEAAGCPRVACDGYHCCVPAPEPPARPEPLPPPPPMPPSPDAPASLGHIEQVGSSRLRIRHPRGVAGQRLLVCVVPCDDYHKEFCPGGVSAEGGDAAVWLSLWHPCIWRSRAQTVYVVLCSAVMTTLAMTAVSLLQIRRHSRTTQQPLAGGHLPRSYRLLLATAASVQLVGALAATGCPYNDDPWRWAVFVGIGPFLLAYVSLATGAQGPMICAILGIFAILWRATWCLHYMVGVDSVLKLAAIRLLVFLLAAGLLIEVLVSLPKRSYYALFKLLATRPDATTPPTPRGATGRRVILAFLAFTLTLAFCSAVAAGLTGIIVLLVDPVPAILVPFVTTAGFIGFVVGLPIGGYLAHYIVRRSGRAEAEEEEDSSSWSAGPLSRPRGFSILLW